MKRAFLVAGLIASFLLLVLTNLIGTIQAIADGNDVWFGAFVGMALGLFLMYFCYKELTQQNKSK